MAPAPFASIEDFEQSQKTHFAAVRRVFEDSDLFIFTLGLTEAWEDVRDGSIYPLCPGTAAGEFNAETYRFRNFTCAEMLEDFRNFENLIREVNLDIRFLLTVSPVPLVATAAGRHVLSATTYSKSVLRAAAGQLSEENPSIDYFPSYEIIASSPAQGRYFENNLRSVRADGVDYVMSHFFNEHKPQSVAHEKQADQEADQNIIEDDLDGADLICEEIFLDRKI